MKDFLLKKLECFNEVEFKFEPSLHKYTYLQEQFTSVTKFIQQFHKPFQQDYWSQKKAQEAGVPQDWILEEWKKLNEYANEVGTDTHQWIEDYFNQIWTPLPKNPDVINRINKFNSLFIHRGKVFILDWKTNKQFTTDQNLKYKEKLLAPFEDNFKSHLSEYSIQLSLYALILEEWGFEIGGAYLVHIGPGEGAAEMHKVIDMRHKLKRYLDGDAEVF